MIALLILVLLIPIWLAISGLMVLAANPPPDPPSSSPPPPGAS